jgi:hypothetical protein
MPKKGQSPYPDMPDIHIGEAGVLKLLNNINKTNNHLSPKLIEYI